MVDPQTHALINVIHNAFDVLLGDAEERFAADEDPREFRVRNLRRELMVAVAAFKARHDHDEETR